MMDVMLDVITVAVLVMVMVCNFRGKVICAAESGFDIVPFAPCYFAGDVSVNSKSGGVLL